MSEKVEPRLSIGELWEKYFQGKDNGNGHIYRNQLILHYINLAISKAKRIHRKLPVRVEIDDLIIAGIKGLEDAIKDFDPSRNIEFEIYSGPRIIGEIYDYLRSEDFISWKARARAKSIARAELKIMLETGWKPTDEQLLEELSGGGYRYYPPNRSGVGLTWEEKIRGIINNRRAPRLVFFSDKESPEKYGRGLNLIKEEKATDPLKEAQKHELKEILTECLARDEKLIIILYYYEGMTMREIGETLDISESRVSQIHAEVLARLKNELIGNPKRLREVMEELEELVIY